MCLLGSAWVKTATLFWSNPGVKRIHLTKIVWTFNQLIGGRFNQTSCGAYLLMVMTVVTGWLQIEGRSGCGYFGLWSFWQGSASRHQLNYWIVICTETSRWKAAWRSVTFTYTYQNPKGGMCRSVTSVFLSTKLLGFGLFWFRFILRLFHGL